MVTSAHASQRTQKQENTNNANTCFPKCFKWPNCNCSKILGKKIFLHTPIINSKRKFSTSNAKSIKKLYYKDLNEIKYFNLPPAEFIKEAHKNVYVKNVFRKPDLVMLNKNNYFSMINMLTEDFWLDVMSYNKYINANVWLEVINGKWTSMIPNAEEPDTFISKPGFFSLIELARFKYDDKNNFLRELRNSWDLIYTVDEAKYLEERNKGWNKDKFEALREQFITVEFVIEYWWDDTSAPIEKPWDHISMLTSNIFYFNQTKNSDVDAAPAALGSLAINKNNKNKSFQVRKFSTSSSRAVRYKNELSVNSKSGKLFELPKADIIPVQYRKGSQVYLKNLSDLKILLSIELILMIVNEFWEDVMSKLNDNQYIHLLVRIHAIHTEEDFKTGIKRSFSYNLTLDNLRKTKYSEHQFPYDANILNKDELFNHFLAAWDLKSEFYAEDEVVAVGF